MECVHLPADMPEEWVAQDYRQNHKSVVSWAEMELGLLRGTGSLRIKSGVLWGALQASCWTCEGVVVREMCCVWFLRQLSNHYSGVPPAPRYSSLCWRILWLMEPDAFERCRSIARKDSRSSGASWMESVKLWKAFVLLWFYSYTGIRQGRVWCQDPA